MRWRSRIGLIPLTLRRKLAQANVPISSSANGTRCRLVKSREVQALKYLGNDQVTDLSRNLIHAHFNHINLGPILAAEKIQVVSETIKFQNGLLHMALAFQYLEPVRGAMDPCQRLLQAIPLGELPLLQLPGFDKNVRRDLKMYSQGKTGLTTIQDLLSLESTEQREALSRLDDIQFHQAINIVKNVPILVVSKCTLQG